jgi:hypothetical protein
MTESLNVYDGPEEPKMSTADLDADAIKDTPYQGALPSAERSSGINFSHQNAAAWKILSETLSEDEYDNLKNSVVERVGEFEEIMPEVVEDDE